MARLKYQPSSRTKGFNPIQLSKEGITNLRNENNRVIDGLQRNLAAEQEQQRINRNAMQENADLEQDRIKRNREIELDNLKNEQLALSQKSEIESKQAEIDRAAQESIVKSLSDFSSTVASRAAENHANMLKDQTAEANARDISEYKQEFIDQYEKSFSTLGSAGIAYDTNIVEDGVESGESPYDTLNSVIGNPGFGAVQDRVIKNRVYKETFPLLVGDSLKSTEPTFELGDGTKFAGIEALQDPRKMDIVNSVTEQNLLKLMGNTEPLYLQEGRTDVQKQRRVLLQQANAKGIENQKVIIEQQAKDLASANTTEGYTLSFVQRKHLGKDKAHSGVEDQVGDPSNDLDAIDRMDLLGDGRRYSEVWPKRWDAGLAKRRANIVKLHKANNEFNKAQEQQFLIDNIDTIRQAYDENPDQATAATQERYHSKGLTVPALIKEIERSAFKNLKNQAQDILNTKIRFQSLDLGYINTIEDPTIRTKAIEAFKVQEEQKYGPEALGIKKGFRATARELTKINPNEGNDSPQTFLVQARLEREYLKALEIRQDPIAALADVNKLVDAANKGDKSSPFYAKTGENNRLVFSAIESVDKDLSEMNQMIDKNMITFGANIVSQSGLLATSDEMDATVISSQNVLSKIQYPPGILRVAEKFDLKPSEVFNAQRQANNLATGENKPLLKPSMSTEVMDELTPTNRKLIQSYNQSQVNRAIQSSTGKLQSNIRGSMQLAYTSGNIGPTSTGPHLDVKRVDGGRFEPNALDDYVVVNDPEFGQVTLGEIRERTGNVGDSWDQHAARGSHGIDYGLHSGTEIYTTNGANVISSTPTEHGDYVVIELPNGDQYSFLHGKG